MGFIPGVIVRYPLVGSYHSERRPDPVLGHLCVRKCALFYLTVAFGTYCRVALAALFTSGLVSPLMTELAAVSRSIEGVGCEHRLDFFGTYG